MTQRNALLRIGVFYDGNYFHHVSNYYAYHHARRSRISIDGLHEFIRHKVAECENADTKYCQIVDAHYFRGRLRAQEAEMRDLLRKERAFDDILMRQGVTTHYLPQGENGEKGIDVWLALEAYELAIYKRFDVIVLLTSDGDFLPLVRKLNTLGARVMVLGWDFNITDQNGNERVTRTAQVLLDEVSYPVLMHQVIDDRSLRNDTIINNMFMPARSLEPREPRTITSGYPGLSSSPNPAYVKKDRDADTTPSGAVSTGEKQAGFIQAIKDGYGFITPDNGGANLFFFHGEVDGDFNELDEGDRVEFEVGSNARGACAVRVHRVGGTSAYEGLPVDDDEEEFEDEDASYNS